MPVPSTIADLSTTANSNSPGGGEAVGPSLDNYLRAHAAIIKRKADEFPSVKDYGAVGDGVTDDRAACQTAIDSGAKKLYWPAGTYAFGARLIPVSDQEWEGDLGSTVLTLLASAANSASVVSLNADGLEGSLDDFSASKIIFDANQKETGFLVYGANRIKFKSCLFRNGGTYGCAFQARPGFSITLPQDDLYFEDCGFEDNGSDAPGWDGLDIKWCTNTRLVGCWADRNTDAGINIRGKEVDLVGCTADGNATSGVLLQSNDDTEDSYIRVIGGGAFGTTAGPGLELQGNNTNTLFLNLSSFQSYGNTGQGVRISGSGFVCGAMSGIESRGNTSHGLQVTGDFISDMVISSSQFLANGGDGINTTGKNTVFNGVKVLGNTGTGYRENTGADNNYLMPNCILIGNIGADIGTRVGAETDPGFMSIRGRRQIRVFPGETAGMELQADASGNHTSVVSVGDAASIDLRLMTKGNGQVPIYKDNGSRQIGLFRAGGSASVNYPDFIASVTGAAVQLKASGSDTDIDLQLTPQGSAGRVRLGTHTATGDTAVSGYIEIKDAGGTTRRLAVIT